MARSHLTNLLAFVWVASFWLRALAVVEMEVLWPNTQHTGQWQNFDDATCPHGSSTSGAVSLTFTGTEVKLWIPRAANGVSRIRLTLDGNSDDVDHNGTTFDCTRWWRYQNLTYSEHTVSVSFIPGTENKDQFLNFYKFTYLTLEETERASLASVSSTSVIASSQARQSAISAISTASVAQVSLSLASVAATRTGATSTTTAGGGTNGNGGSGSNNNGNDDSNGVTKKSSSNIGPIVGGIVGGILGLAIIAFLLWKFRNTLFGTSRTNNDSNDGHGEKPITGTVITGPPTMAHMPGSNTGGAYAYHQPPEQQAAFGVYPQQTYQGTPTTSAYDSTRPMSAVTQPGTWNPAMGQPGYNPQYPAMDQFGQPIQPMTAYPQQYPQGVYPPQQPNFQTSFNPATYGAVGAMGAAAATSHSYNAQSNPAEPPPGYPGRSLPQVPDNLTSIGSPATHPADSPGSSPNLMAFGAGSSSGARTAHGYPVDEKRHF